jgi:hypothetical protein
MRHDGGFRMKFRVSDLVTTLKKNLDEHKTIYAEATEGFKAEFEKILKEKLSDLKEGKVPSTHLALTVPSTHAKDYEDAIKMLEMTSDDHVVLDQSLFDAYVLDQWSWQGSFLTNSSNYGSTSARSKMS